MAATSSLRACMQALGSVVPTDAGWNPGDSIIDVALGQIGQIGQDVGGRYLRPDPLTVADVALGSQVLLTGLLAPVYIGHTVKIAGQIVRANGGTPIGPAIVTVNVNVGGGVAILNATAATAGIVVLQFILNAAADAATVTLFVPIGSVTGAWDVTFTAAAAAAGTARVWTNADASDPIALVIP